MATSNNTNSQLSYSTGTIDPAIANIAAKDPGYALGLLLSSAWINNYNARGEDKLKKAVLGEDGQPTLDGTQATTSGTQPATDGTQAISGTDTTANINNAINQNLGATGINTGNTQQTQQATPQIFSANQQNPLSASTMTGQYRINPGITTTTPDNATAQQTSDAEKIAMANTIKQAAAESAINQAGAAEDSEQNKYKQALMERVRAILNDENNAWAQSAARGEIYNKVGNPYSIGNYDDQSKNLAYQQSLANMANKWTPHATMNADGTVSEPVAQGYTAQNPLQGMQYQATLNNPNSQYNFQTGNMGLNTGETATTAPILDAVQNAQDVKQAVVNNSVPGSSYWDTMKLGQPTNFIKAEQDNGEPVQQDKEIAEPVKENKESANENSQPQETHSDTVKSTPTENFSQNSKNLSVGQTNKTTPFTVKDWISKVTIEGIKQGRPMNQIQNVIAQTLPMAQAQEDRYKKEAIGNLTNRIFNGDETTGGKSLLPTATNYQTQMPKLMRTLQEIYAVDPEQGERIANAVGVGYKDAWSLDKDNFVKARDAQTAMALSKADAENKIRTHEANNQSDYKKAVAQYMAKDQMEQQQINRTIGYYKAAGLSDQDAIKAAMANYSSGSKKSGSSAGITGDGSSIVQKGPNGRDVINGFELTAAQQTRANEIGANVSRRMDELESYMKSVTRDDIENGDGDDNLAKAIDGMREYIKSLDDGDQALIPNEISNELQQALYAANYIREYKAGNGKTDIAKAYLSALTDETKKKYNIIT